MFWVGLAVIEGDSLGCILVKSQFLGRICYTVYDLISRPYIHILQKYLRNCTINIFKMDKCPGIYGFWAFAMTLNLDICLNS